MELNRYLNKQKDLENQGPFVLYVIVMLEPFIQLLEI